MNIYSVRYSVIDSPDDRTKTAIVIIGERDYNSHNGIKRTIADDLVLNTDDIEIYNIIAIREIMGENQVIHTV